MRRNGAFFLITCGAAFLAVSGAGLAINWSMLGGDAEHSGYRADPLDLPISLLWKYRAAGEKAVVTVWSSPAASEDAVFFCYDTSLYCVDRMTGQLRWQYQAQTQLRSSPAIDERAVYVGGRNGMLYAVARDTGQLMWRYPLPGKKGIDSSPTIFNGTLYVGADDYKVYAIDLATRQLRWQFNTSDEVKAPPMVRGGVCYAVSVDGKIYAIDDRGQQIWWGDVGPSPAFSGPTFERDKVIAAAGRQVVALDARTGIRRWTFNDPGDLISGTPAVANRMVYVGSKDGSLYGVNASTGHAQWRYPSGADKVTQQILSGPAVRGDTVFARTVNGLLIGVNARSGKLEWRYNMLVPAEKAAQREEGGGGRGDEEEEEAEEETEEEEGYDEDEEGGFFGGGGGFRLGGGSRGGRDRYRTGRTSRRIRNPREASPGFGAPYARTGIRYAEGIMPEFRDNVLSSLAVSGDAIYALGDDGALYALDAAAADKTPPEISEAALQIPGADRNTYQVGLDVADGAEIPGRFARNAQVPGTPPLTVSVKLFDEGSGVDESTIRITLDGQPQDAWTYDEKDSLLWFSYNPGGAIARSLPNGQHDVVIQASDYRGQVAVASLSFIVDNALPAPTSDTPGAGRGDEEEEEEEDEDDEY